MSARCETRAKQTRAWRRPPATGVLLLLLTLLAVGPARGQAPAPSPQPADPPAAPSGGNPPIPAPEREAPIPAAVPTRGDAPILTPNRPRAAPRREETEATFSATVSSRRPAQDARSGRAATRVETQEIARRLPRSMPDALRFEPGVYIQQTASSQGSPYIRGLTGQQTLLLFDGVRINNSLFRQGPNQYLFTVDPRVVQAIEVTRGSASVLWGSDALGGVIELQPFEPRPTAVGRWSLRPKLTLRGGTADDERGGRLQAEAAWGERVALLAGVGGRRVGLLEGGGQLYGVRGEPALVPRLAPDGRTQLGTGFDELTGDARLVVDLGHRQQLRAATYLYRQYDAPRTDRCPSAYAPQSECQTFDEQFRSLAYLSWDGLASPGSWLRSWRVTGSYQRQHERRTLSRPASHVENGGRDDVDTLGLSARGHSRYFELAPGLAAGASFGLDANRDAVDSAAWSGFSDLPLRRTLPRGQYLDGSRYHGGGAFGQGELLLGEALVLRGGVRGAYSGAQAAADPESGSAAVDRTWRAMVAGGGLRYKPLAPLTLVLNLDQGFRAPNLDDLTARQQVGPGFQLENATLDPERSLTAEAGVQLTTSPLAAELWAFRTTLADAITRRTVSVQECPAGNEGEGCRSSWHRYRLVNAGDDSEVLGLEAMVKLTLPAGWSLRSTLSYARGEGPNPGTPPVAPAEAQSWRERVPLSRVPPLNGTAELVWRCPTGPLTGLQLGGGVRWALAQDRLALSDESDPRIPPGGTPGYLVSDLWLGHGLGERLKGSLLLENWTDEVYRTHGSSINGPARSVTAQLELGW